MGRRGDSDRDSPASLEEITADDFRREKTNAGQGSLSVGNAGSGKKGVWMGYTSAPYSLYSFAWAQAVQNKPLMANTPEDEEDAERESDVAGEDGEKEEGEIEEGEIGDAPGSTVLPDEAQLVDLDSPEVQLAEGKIDEVQEDCEDEGDFDLRVAEILEELETVTAEEAEKSFEDCCTKLRKSFESLKPPLFPEDGSFNSVRDTIVQQAFAGINSVISVVRSYFLPNREKNKNMIVKLLIHIKNQYSGMLTPEQLAELDKNVNLLYFEDSDGDRGQGTMACKPGMASMEKSMLSTGSSNLYSLQSDKSIASRGKSSSMLLDLHVDYDESSLPSPTRDNPPPLLLPKPIGFGDARTVSRRPVSPLDLQPHSAQLHPYVRDALQAVSSYQQKFGHHSLATDLPSPTPSGDGNNNKNDDDIPGEVSSSLHPGGLAAATMLRQAPPAFLPSISRIDAPTSGQSERMQQAQSPGLQLCSVQKPASKSRDPRLRLVNSTTKTGSVDHNRNLLSPCTNALKDGSVGVPNSRKTKAADGVLADENMLKKPKNGTVDVIESAMLGKGGLIEESFNRPSYPSGLIQLPESNKIEALGQGKADLMASRQLMPNVSGSITPVGHLTPQPAVLPPRPQSVGPLPSHMPHVGLPQRPHMIGIPQMPQTVGNTHVPQNFGLLSMPKAGASPNIHQTAAISSSLQNSGFSTFGKAVGLPNMPQTGRPNMAQNAGLPNMVQSSGLLNLVPSGGLPSIPQAAGTQNRPQNMQLPFNSVGLSRMQQNVGLPHASQHISQNIPLPLLLQTAAQLASKSASQLQTPPLAGVSQGQPSGMMQTAPSNAPPAISLPDLLKDMAANPAVLRQIIQMDQQRQATEARPKGDTLSAPYLASNSLPSNATLGCISTSNIASGSSPVIHQNFAGVSSVPSQTNSPQVLPTSTPMNNQNDRGVIRMKPRDPRHALHSSMVLKSDSASELQKINATNMPDSQKSKDMLVIGEQGEQTQPSSLPSQSVFPTNAAPHINDALSSSPVGPATTTIAASITKQQLPSAEDIRSSGPFVGPKNLSAGAEASNASGGDSTSLVATNNPWGDVDHLLDGYDDEQKAAIQKERARRIMEQHNMFAARKLCLVLDIDHTLLNSAKFIEIDPVHEDILRKKEEQDRERPQRHLFRFQHMGMWTKLRPGIWNFLEKASKLFELHLYTMGNKAYATEMAKVLDPSGTLFAGRVISRGDDGDSFDGDDRAPKSKDLEGVLGMESAVVIIDDSVRVWPLNKHNLIVVERYTYFPCSRRQFGLPGPALLEVDRDERPEDGTLSASLAVIERIHQNFFAHPSLNEADVRTILAEEQRKILSGCRIVFSRIFPVGEANPHLHPLWQTAEQFGAVCTTQLDDQVTHVVAHSLGTDKVNWALSTGRSVVHPGWVEASALLYRRANEQDFAVK